MHTLLSNDIEQVNQLYQFMQAMKRYHEEVFYGLLITLNTHTHTVCIDTRTINEQAGATTKHNRTRTLQRNG